MKEYSISYEKAKQETEKLIAETEKNTITHRSFTAECLRRILKENEELKEELETEQNERLLCHIREKQMIPVQKIKDKIEELKAQYKTALEENTTEAFILKCQITILKELIEEREEK